MSLVRWSGFVFASLFTPTSPSSLTKRRNNLPRHFDELLPIGDCSPNLPHLEHPMVPLPSLVPSRTIRFRINSTGGFLKCREDGPGGSLPTNLWWQGLILNQGAKAINVEPYCFKMTQTGFIISAVTGAVCQDRPTSVSSSPSNWQLGLVNDERSLIDLTHRVVPGLANGHHKVELSWGNRMSCHLMRGSPYLSANVTHPTRVRMITNSKILQLKHQLIKGQCTRWSVKLTNDQVWLIYSTSDISWVMSSNCTLTTDRKYSGYLRLVRLPTDLKQPQYIDLLDSAAHIVPTDCHLSFDLLTSATSSLLNYSFRTELAYTHNNRSSNRRDRTDNLLMLVPPAHHSRMVFPDNKIMWVSYSLNHQPLALVMGSQWLIDMELPEHLLRPETPRTPPPGLTEIDNSQIHHNNKDKFQDRDLELTGTRLMYLINTINHSNDSTDGDKGKPKSVLFGQLKNIVSKWLGDGSADNNGNLVYDRTWGGIVTRLGISDASADLSNGWYHDHLSQYGPFIEACNIIIRREPNWLTDPIKDSLLCLLRDLINPTPSDNWFAVIRGFDFYWGVYSRSGLLQNKYSTFHNYRHQPTNRDPVMAYQAIHRLSQQLNLPQTGRLAHTLLAIMDLSSSHNKFLHATDPDWQTNTTPTGLRNLTPNSSSSSVSSIDLNHQDDGVNSSCSSLTKVALDTLYYKPELNSCANSQSDYEGSPPPSAAPSLKSKRPSITKRLLGLS